MERRTLVRADVGWTLNDNDDDDDDVVLCYVLIEASSNVRAKAVKDYNNTHEPTHITFKEGDLITVSIT